MNLKMLAGWQMNLRMLVGVVVVSFYDVKLRSVFIGSVWSYGRADTFFASWCMTMDHARTGSSDSSYCMCC